MGTQMMHLQGTVQKKADTNPKSTDENQTAALIGNISCETPPDIVKVCR